MSLFPVRQEGIKANAGASLVGLESIVPTPGVG